jgi:hypothetical protein
MWGASLFGVCVLGACGSTPPSEHASQEQLTAAAGSVASAFCSAFGSCCSARSLSFDGGGCLGAVTSRVFHELKYAWCPPAPPTEAEVLRCAEAVRAKAETCRSDDVGAGLFNNYTIHAACYPLLMGGGKIEQGELCDHDCDCRSDPDNFVKCVTPKECVQEAGGSGSWGLCAKYRITGPARCKVAVRKSDITRSCVSDADCPANTAGETCRDQECVFLKPGESAPNATYDAVFQLEVPYAVSPRTCWRFKGAHARPSWE